MTTTPDMRAERFLAGHLSESMGSVTSISLFGGNGAYVGSGSWPQPSDDDDLDLGVNPLEDSGPAVLGALEATAVLPTAKTERWKHLFALALGGRPVAPPRPELRSRGQSYLATLAAAFQAEEDEAVDQRELDRLGGAVAALSDLGLVESDPLPSILRGLLGGTVAHPDEPLTGEEFPLPPPPETTDDQYEQPESRSIGEPLQVIAGPTSRREGLCFTCVELHTRGLILHWHEVVEAGGDDAMEDSFDRLDRTFTLADDVGTEYTEASTTSSHGPAWSPGPPRPSGLWGSAVSRTSVPDEASRLDITTGDAHWRLDLVGGPTARMD